MFDKLSFKSVLIKKFLVLPVAVEGWLVAVVKVDGRKFTGEVIEIVVGD